jgi:hypothetical protein
MIGENRRWDDVEKNQFGIELVAIGPRERIYEETFRIIQKEEGK